jgi:hypothetical protein
MSLAKAMAVLAVSIGALCGPSLATAQQPNLSQQQLEANRVHSMDDRGFEQYFQQSMQELCPYSAGAASAAQVCSCIAAKTAPLSRAQKEDMELNRTRSALFNQIFAACRPHGGS